MSRYTTHAHMDTRTEARRSSHEPPRNLTRHRRSSRVPHAQSSARTPVPRSPSGNTSSQVYLPIKRHKRLYGRTVPESHTQGRPIERSVVGVASGGPWAHARHHSRLVPTHTNNTSRFSPIVKTRGPRSFWTLPQSKIPVRPKALPNRVPSFFNTANTVLKLLSSLDNKAAQIDFLLAVPRNTTTKAR